MRVCNLRSSLCHVECCKCCRGISLLNTLSWDAARKRWDAPKCGWLVEGGECVWALQAEGVPTELG